MKNFKKEGQKLPLFGIGPYLVSAMGVITLLAVFLFQYVLKMGILPFPGSLLLRILGGSLIVLGLCIGVRASFYSHMDEHIQENRLNTGGIYAWARNPMYTGWWLLIAGIGLMWGNVWLLLVPFLNWALMTLVIKNTEEVWLSRLYGEEYRLYLRRVNRFIPWKGRE